MWRASTPGIQQHFLETLASTGGGENSVRAMKDIIQRQKDAVFSLVY